MPFDPYSLMRLKYGPMQGTFALGTKDPILAQGRWRGFYPYCREVDPLTYDPRITNSQVSAREGTDSHFDPTLDTAYRYMGVPIDEWRYKVLYRQNPTIKRIYDNWDISDQHPGMEFRNGVRSPWQTLQYQGHLFPAGQYFFHRVMPGGKYFDAPDGEQCFTKAWSCAKFAMLVMFPICLTDWMVGSSPIGYKNRIKNVFYKSHVPVSAAYVWGAVTCLTCSYRKENDLINNFFGSLAAGFIFGIRLGVFSGIRGVIGAFVASSLWRLFQDGPLGLEMNDHVNVNLGDALSHKWGRLATNISVVPKRDY